ncbi:DUF1848 family protein [Desulfofundulus thermobenzoicus]|nr:DUF1848 family protein [Desulfofundulus thermobenzoicus]
MPTKKIISMSRRTDPRWHAEKFITILQQKYPPADVHTVVLWTKFPQAILTAPYRDVLKQYDQIYCQITITGLGGTPLEPKVPPWEETVALLPALAGFAGGAERVRLRVDPLVFLEYKGTRFSNLARVEMILNRALEAGIRTFSTSFMEAYPKVYARLKAHGFKAIGLSPGAKQRVINHLSAMVRERGGTLYTCAVPGFPISRCIDGELLTRLHPQGERCRMDKAAGQRALCGCTHSVDIGWYNMRCPSGCLYCYANPV